MQLFFSVAAVTNIGLRSTYANVPAVHDSVFANNVDQDLMTHINTIPGSVSYSELLCLLCV